MEHETPGYEAQDVNATKTLLAISGFVVILVVFLVALNEYFAHTSEKLYYQQVLQPESLALRDLRLREAAALNSYRRLENGVYVIPVEQAMNYIAKQNYVNGGPTSRPAGTSDAP